MIRLSRVRTLVVEFPQGDITVQYRPDVAKKQSLIKPLAAITAEDVAGRLLGNEVALLRARRAQQFLVKYLHSVLVGWDLQRGLGERWPFSEQGLRDLPVVVNARIANAILEDVRSLIQTEQCASPN